MSRFAFTLLVALAVAAIGFGARHYVQALGPYGLVGVMWATIAIFMVIWRPLSVSAFISSITISSAICLPIVAYLINQWLGFGVGAVIFYLASKWAEKLKDRSSPNAGQ
ncbi:hypothetical protein [Neorhizobium sp. IRS_2294]|uniref:hypothetical protein n=1 Tax=unclassified Neorhizobium TaxID=2629175 RepID=UPI003D2A708B